MFERAQNRRSTALALGDDLSHCCQHAEPVTMSPPPALRIHANAAPSAQGVAGPLQPHVHLISLHRYPSIASLNVEAAFRYLLDAPSIVKQIAPMSWNYVSTPQAGTLWLEWIPLEKSDQPFPSDGYVWADPESSYRQEFGGYTIEMRMHVVGYRPGIDQMAQHARTRYHFINKNPSLSAPPPDPSLWLVHYHQSDRVMPAQQLPISQHMQQTMAQRRWLEAQGRLERRDFMLHDREHWPTLNVPNQMQQTSQYGATAMQNRYPQQHYPQPSAGPPAAKKARTSGPSISMPGSSDGQHDSSIELEEDTALGDFFDHLTQRDISVARYTQHHRWMEEVFSSPYTASQIAPPDLGLGLMGELKGLTDGILEPPIPDLTDRPTTADSKPQQAKEAKRFTNLKQEQFEEFNKRVEKHIQEGQAEIERMKTEHAAKMQDWKKVKSLMQAEKRLRQATWEGHENAVPAYRLEEPATKGHTEEGAPKESVDDIVKEVEDALKVKIISHEDARCVAKGGFQERKQPSYDPDQYLNQQDTLLGVPNEQSQETQNPSAANDGSAAEPTTHRADPANVSQPPAGGQMLVVPNANEGHAMFETSQEQPLPGAGGASQVEGSSTAGEAFGDISGINMDDALMDGMDLDVGDSNIDFGDDNAAGLNGSPAMPPEPSRAQVSGTDNTDAAASVAPSTTQPPREAVAQQNEQQAPPSTTDLALAGESGLGDDTLAGDVGDTSMFNDTFDDLTNIDNGDDGLIDFDGGGMGMDDSAFGDALHGMDAPEGSGNGSTPAGGQP